MKKDFDITECRKAAMLRQLMGLAFYSAWLNAACEEIERLRAPLSPSRKDLEAEIDDLREQLAAKQPKLQLPLPLVGLQQMAATTQLDYELGRIHPDNFAPMRAAMEWIRKAGKRAKE